MRVSFFPLYEVYNGIRQGNTFVSVEWAVSMKIISKCQSFILRTSFLPWLDVFVNVRLCINLPFLFLPNIYQVFKYSSSSLIYWTHLLYSVKLCFFSYYFFCLFFDLPFHLAGLHYTLSSPLIKYIAFMIFFYHVHLPLLYFISLRPFPNPIGKFEAKIKIPPMYPSRFVKTRIATQLAREQLSMSPVVMGLCT